MAKRELDLAVFTAMNGNDPVAAYRKTTLGKVFVTVLNMFSQEPEALLLYGEPNVSNPDSIVYMYSIPEDVFFRRQNRRHFQDGTIIPVAIAKKEEVQPVAEDLPLEQSSDEQLRQLVNSKFKALEAALNKTESEALLNRLVAIARDEEKSERIVKAIETRLSEVQLSQYSTSEE